MAIFALRNQSGDHELYNLFVPLNPQSKKVKKKIINSINRYRVNKYKFVGHKKLHNINETPALHCHHQNKKITKTLKNKKKKERKIDSHNYHCS